MSEMLCVGRFNGRVPISAVIQRVEELTRRLHSDPIATTDDGKKVIDVMYDKELDEIIFLTQPQ
jgi:hypothetical protein